MRAPAFWSSPPGAPGLAARLLWPASLLWRLGTALRRLRASPGRAPVPVVCIGNLTAGGAGKTPLVQAIAERLAGQGVAVAVVSRGHGGRCRGPHRVDPAADSAAEVGDEPLLLAQTLPVWVARDRLAGARAAAAGGAALVLLDDGAQNPHIAKDLTILAVDAEAGFGNGRVMPAGPLREPVADGLARADLAVLIGPEPARARLLADWPALGRLPCVAARLAPPATGLALAGLPVVAFAGIGRPEKFFATLRGMGARLAAAHAFPDHHVYPPRVLRRLLAEARRQGAMLVTTEKDAVRLPPEFRREAMALPIRLEPEDWAPLETRLAALLPR